MNNTLEKIVSEKLISLENYKKIYKIEDFKKKNIYI